MPDVIRIPGGRKIREFEYYITPSVKSALQQEIDVEGLPVADDTSDVVPIHDLIKRKPTLEPPAFAGTSEDLMDDLAVETNSGLSKDFLNRVRKKSWADEAVEKISLAAKRRLAEEDVREKAFQDAYEKTLALQDEEEAREAEKRKNPAPDPTIGMVDDGWFRG